MLLERNKITPHKSKKGEKALMGTAIEYQKLMTEIVYINLPGPEAPTPGMSGGELLHGFLAELHRAPNQEMKNYIDLLCSRWNIRFREQKG
jgi:hypothetical protein